MKGKIFFSDQANLEELAALEETTGEGYSRNLLTKAMDEPHAHLLVARNTQSELLGFLLYWIVIDILEIHRVVVSKNFRRQGVAQALIEEVIKKHPHCLELQLEVRSDNHPAISLYKKMGFIQNGVRKHYYKDGMDALQMTLCIPS